MNKNSSGRHFPSDLGCMLFSWIFIPVIAVVSAKILPLILAVAAGDLCPIYYSALGFAVLGTALLFFARLPLYQQGIFWTVGPKLLDRSHRRLYWLAYLLVLVSVGLFAVIWFSLVPKLHLLGLTE